MRKGFTLIELLVVIAIIGLLSSVVFASLEGARQSARDAKRISEIKEVQKALEFYYDDNGVYPGVSTSWWSTCTTSSALKTALAPYLSSFPSDPKGGWPFCYYYKLGNYSPCAGSHQYTILFATEKVVYESLPPYGIQGENGSAARYCIHPE